MNRSRPIARLATADDFRAFFGREPPPAGTWSGYVAERVPDIPQYRAPISGAGRIVGFATLRGLAGRAWVSLDSRERLPAAMMHRTALRALADLDKRGLKAVHAHPNSSIAGAEKWLRRLGFEVDEQMTADCGEQVWSRRLNG